MTWAAYGPPRAAYGPQNPSDDGLYWHSASENDISVICIAAGQIAFDPASEWRPQQDSNLRSRLRSPRLFKSWTCTDLPVWTFSGRDRGPSPNRSSPLEPFAARQLKSVGQSRERPAHVRRPQQDSNLCSSLRREPEFGSLSCTNSYKQATLACCRSGGTPSTVAAPSSCLAYGAGKAGDEQRREYPRQQPQHPAESVARSQFSRARLAPTGRFKSSPTLSCWTIVQDRPGVAELLVCASAPCEPSRTASRHESATTAARYHSARHGW